MSEQQVVVHIGLSKCASTYLQKTIFPGMGNYSNVAFAPRREKYHLFYDGMTPDSYREIVARHMVNPNPKSRWLVLSCEDYTELMFQGFEDVFYDWERVGREHYRYSNKMIAENIARTYPGAKIVVVIREQISWAISRYKMNYRGGKTSAGIDELMAEPLEGYDVMVERYQRLFGRENVLVMPLEMMREDRDGFVNQITRFIGEEQRVDAPDLAVNAAPELLRTVEYERLKNRWRLNIHRTGWLTMPGRFLIGAVARLLVGLTKPTFYLKYGSEIYSAAPSEQVVARLHPLLAESNRKLESLTGLELAKYGYIVD
ncbi:hypothetical protein BOW53_11475 [Solemya pervernicosa gill symbiont]|uniref:Sulfotransferase domain-containing protein n=2 Tax=Gammaproteobacteria incertae sedis TaxID=118884 RepID=A0A1T2L362_9GAMM|nr:sulfotransferase [Candidatus Reidiella endopervernicosa]OOZ39521.1 hypothetical protein BOW53_11475 [Solemya pervernicosa gill symbiont]QKQ25862.1 sulfotransferase [Candidatus Reidiella endopervernicosa]